MFDDKPEWATNRKANFSRRRHIHERTNERTRTEMIIFHNSCIAPTSIPFPLSFSQRNVLFLMMGNREREPQFFEEWCYYLLNRARAKERENWMTSCAGWRVRGRTRHYGWLLYPIRDRDFRQDPTYQSEQGGDTSIRRS